MQKRNSQRKESRKRNKSEKEKPVKAAKPVEILTDPEEIKEVEERAIVFLRDVFGSMDLGEVEITSKYNTTDGCLEVDFEGEDMGNPHRKKRPDTGFSSVSDKPCGKQRRVYLHSCKT